MKTLVLTRNNFRLIAFLLLVSVAFTACRNDPLDDIEEYSEESFRCVRDLGLVQGNPRVPVGVLLGFFSLVDTDRANSKCGASFRMLFQAKQKAIVDGIDHKKIEAAEKLGVSKSENP